MIENANKKLEIKLETYVDKWQTYVTCQGAQPNPSRPTSPNHLGFKAKLPDIKLAEFHGNNLEWTQFWNQFNSMVHERSNIDESTKFTYLNQCIKGSARQYLTGLKGQASDYETVVISLKQQCGDKKKVT
ncbi:uncharacterized protein LOC143034825 [Oratosquilla oratoria]|uniref:uncharacterized protein LOC143034825 n=1 Tax=Oratosquilla oratoria TaxID=337810 RepID=UPI003F7656B7